MKTSINLCSVGIVIFFGFVGVCYAQTTQEPTKNTTEETEHTTEEPPKFILLTILQGIQRISEGVLTVVEAVITIPIKISTLVSQFLQSVIDTGVFKPVSWQRKPTTSPP
ncbi:hypothetical protein C0J52_10293 [Blattella germanica]|nr:hypothetical protein C0J52_10293 [Blattella germanica]